MLNVLREHEAVPSLIGRSAKQLSEDKGSRSTFSAQHAADAGKFNSSEEKQETTKKEKKP